MRNILALIIICAFFALHLLLAVGLDPLADECYYWVWSTHPSLSYFDHPPMVAWINWLLGQFLPPAWAIKTAAALLGAGTAWFMWLVFKRMGKNSTGWRLLLAASLTPAFFTAGFIFTPDTPQLFFLTAAFYCLLSALESDTWPAWLFSGLMLGLGLLSKYTSVLLPLAVFIYLLWQQPRRLLSIKPWLAMLLAVAVFSPVIWWNYQHDWASFAFQLNHGLRNHQPTIGRYLPEYLGGQAGIVGPFFFVLVIVQVFNVLRRHRRADRQELFAAICFSVFFGLFLLSAVKNKVEANWPGFGWLPGLAVLAAGIKRELPHWQKRLLRVNTPFLAIAMTLIVIQLHYPFLGLKKDPTAMFHGYKAQVAAFDSLSRQYPDAIPAAQGYQEASYLTMMLGREVPSLALGVRDNQWKWWRSMPPGANYLIVDKSPANRPELRAAFTSVQQVGVLPREYRGNVLGYWYVWYCQGYKPGTK